MSKNINTFAAGLLALTSIAAASVGCQPQASEQTAANPTEFVEQTETVDATETEAASTFEPTEEPTDEPTEPTEASGATDVHEEWIVDERGIIPETVNIIGKDGYYTASSGVAVCTTRNAEGRLVLQVWNYKGLEREFTVPEEMKNRKIITYSRKPVGVTIMFYRTEADYAVGRGGVLYYNGEFSFFVDATGGVYCDDQRVLIGTKGKAICYSWGSNYIDVAHLGEGIRVEAWDGCFGINGQQTELGELIWSVENPKNL